MQLTPQRASSSTSSLNGKNASDAQAKLSADTPNRPAAVCARSHAIIALSTRFSWPQPRPKPALSLAIKIAFDLTVLQTFHANNRSSSSFWVGCFFGYHPKRARIFTCTIARLNKQTTTYALKFTCLFFIKSTCYQHA